MVTKLGFRFRGHKLRDAPYLRERTWNGRSCAKGFGFALAGWGGMVGGSMSRPPHSKHLPHRPNRGGPAGSAGGGKRAAGSPGRGGDAAGEKGWDPVAVWYDKLVGDHGSDYHRQVILPAAMRLLAPQPGEVVLDLCCGQGVLAGLLVEAGVARVTAVDASRRLVEAGRARHGGEGRIRWVVADACQAGEWVEPVHDAAACLMAVHDVADAAALFRQAAGALRAGGRLVMICMHPCFRLPRHSHWGWDADQKIQFRRMDRYSGELAVEVTTHPGKGPEAGTTRFHHRPLAGLIGGMAAAGLVVDGCEELHSHRRSQGGGAFSKAEHRAAEEFPLFLALRARKV